MAFYTPKKKKCNKLVKHEIPLAHKFVDCKYIAKTGRWQGDTLYLNDTYFTQMSILGQVTHLKRQKRRQSLRTKNENRFKWAINVYNALQKLPYSMVYVEVTRM